jgi:hypothetical protein
LSGPATCLREPLHLGAASSCSLSPPTQFIVLFCYSSSFRCFFPPFHTLVLFPSAQPTLGCLPRSSSKLRLSYLSTLFVLHLFINYMC